MQGIELPGNVPQSIKEEFEVLIEASNIAQLAGTLTSRVTKLFHARDGLLFLRMPEAEWNYYCNDGFSVENETEAPILKLWIESGLKNAVAESLIGRFAAVSYSSFAWPFGSIALSEDSAVPCAGFPRNYAIFVPFSSSMIVMASIDIRFSGYCALFFDEFPDITEDKLQLIVTLPELVSNVLAAYFREHGLFMSCVACSAKTSEC